MSSVSQDITNKRILAMAIPMVLSNVTVPILGVVDTAVVGQLGEAGPIGAVGIGAIILTAVYWVFGFLRMGTTGLTAQAVGAKSQAEIDANLMRAVGIGAAAGAIYILFQVPIFWGAFKLAPASPEVEYLAREYMQIRIFSAPAVIMIYGITGWLIARERTGQVFAIQFVMNVTNIGLDFMFVMGFDAGVPGVAWATFIAEWIGAGLGLYLCRNVFYRPYWRDKALLLARDKMRHMIGINRDIMIRSVLLQAMFLSFLFIGSSFGDVKLAANQILLQFLYVTAYAMDGVTFAAESLVGQAKGAGDRVRFRRAVVLPMKWAAGLVLVLVAVFALFGGHIIDMMTTAGDVRIVARDYLIYLVCAPIAGMLAWMFDGIYIGATAGKMMRDRMLVSAVIYAISVAIFVPIWGNHGLWIAFVIGFVARSLTMLQGYRALEAGVATRP